MARIPREEHSEILRRVDVANEKVADVAAAYDCTPANIYNILKKLRSAGTATPAEGAAPVEPITPSVAEQKPEPESVPRTEPVAAPVFEPAAANFLEPGATQPEAGPIDHPSADLTAVAAPRLPLDLLSSLDAGSSSSEAPPQATASPQPSRKPAATASTVSSKATPKTPPRAPKAPAPSSARAGKPGYGLLMRTSDGEEAVHPFRSLDELLSATKPILRTAARSPEPIWFSIQQVDLDSIEETF